MRIYLDACCVNRPYDEFTVDEIANQIQKKRTKHST
jgi:hypothetical protein